MYVVVGATESIGKSIAQTLTRKGLQVLVFGCKPKKLAKLRSKAPSNLTIAPIDLSDPNSISPACEAVLPSKLSGLVQCSGSQISSNVFRRIDPEHLVYHFNTYLRSMKALFREIRKRTSGIDRMVIVDSRSANTSQIGWGALSILKTPAQISASAALDDLENTSIARVFIEASTSEAPEFKSDIEAEKAYKSMLSEGGKLPSGTAVTAFVSSILVDMPLETFRSHNTWDYNNPEHRTLAKSFR